MCQNVICSYVVDYERGILQSIDANKLPILVAVDELEGAPLDMQWPLKVPLKMEAQAVASSCVQAAVTVANVTGVLADEMTHGFPHSNPRARQCLVDKLYLASH
jgi:hypothetical protein